MADHFDSEYGLTNVNESKAREDLCEMKELYNSLDITGRVQFMEYIRLFDQDSRPTDKKSDSTDDQDPSVLTSQSQVKDTLKEAKKSSEPDRTPAEKRKRSSRGSTGKKIERTTMSGL